MVRRNKRKVMYNKIIYFSVCKWPGLVALEGIVTYVNIYTVHRITLCVTAAHPV